MDRRQKKSRDAIFKAFSELLAQKNYNRISVQMIIDRANVARTTFYSHFETKDFLLREMCDELFQHLVNTTLTLPGKLVHEFCQSKGESVFLHLVRHLQENDLKILDLLSSDNNAIFMKVFRKNLEQLIRQVYVDNNLLLTGKLPEDFVVQHLAASFVQTISYWVERKMPESPEQITSYYLLLIDNFVKYESN